MRIRRCVAIAAIVLIGAEYSSAFKFKIHAEITEEALVAVFDHLTDAWRKSLVRGFSSDARDEIANADISQDTGDCGDKDNPKVAAKPCTVWGSELAAALEIVEATPHPDHFDAEAIQAGSDLVYQRRQQILAYLLEKNFVGARKELGRALHGIQDFYAHTNWVELGSIKLENRLGTKDGFRDTSISPRLATEFEPTCLLGEYPLNQLNAEVKNDLIALYREKRGTTLITYEALLKAFVDRPLTSGFFFITYDPRLGTLNTKPDLPVITNYGKCRHGYTVPGVYEQGGINKDESSRGMGFINARGFALAHSANFITELLSERDVQKDPAIIPGFMGHPAIYSLSPATAQPGQEGFSMEVNGSGFTQDPVVLWNGKPLTTRLSHAGLLTAEVTKADLAATGSVEVRVREPEAYKSIRMVSANDTLLSNPVTFTIDQPEDCPGAIRPHRHDPRYVDVNARQWTNTGLVFLEGTMVSFEVLRGSVVWRAGGLFTGSAGEAPPEGDPSATPANTLLWIDPQIPINRAPVGALIGMIPDPQTIGPYPEKPEGARYFPILAGGRPIPMPAGGRLHLGINDGAFFNNGGCFQVRVTTTK